MRSPANGFLDCTRPVVIVVGDFRSHDSFAWGAWRRICSAYGDAGGASVIPPLQPAQSISPEPTSLPIWRALDDTVHASAFPIALSDMGEFSRADVQGLILRYLANLNVISVVACGTARNTHSLLERLSPLPTPVMVVVDSTVMGDPIGTAAMHGCRSTLRLVPSNDLQAQAILGRVSVLAEFYSQPEIQIFSSGSTEYVIDLTRVLDEQWKHTVRGATAVFTSDASKLRSDAQHGVLVCVGYWDAFQQLLACGKKWRHLIVSDGCSELLRYSADEAENIATEYCVTRPAFSYADYACDAYVGVSIVWRQLTDSARSGPVAAKMFPGPFHSQVAATLERLWPNRYKFRGNENLRGGYVVERVSAKG